tara:strand:+ start:1563 stop:2273 length:711 start_codon:yes stop_codon:yes gene_type:complete
MLADTVCAFEQVESIRLGGVSVVIPNVHRYALPGENIVMGIDAFGVTMLKAVITDLPLWFIGEATQQPRLLGKWFPVHRKVNDPHLWAKRFLWHRAFNCFNSKYLRQLEQMLGIMGDRPRAIIAEKELPFRGFRRDAWGLSSKGDGVIDRKYMTTALEAFSCLSWEQGKLIDSGDMATPLKRKIFTRRFDLIKEGEIDPVISEWRRSDNAPTESRFECKNAQPFDVRWLRKEIAYG